MIVHFKSKILHLFFFFLFLASCSNTSKNDKLAKETLGFLKEINSFFESASGNYKVSALEKIVSNHKGLLQKLRNLQNIKYSNSLKKEFHKEFERLMKNVMKPEVYRNKKLRGILNTIFQ